MEKTISLAPQSAVSTSKTITPSDLTLGVIKKYICPMATEQEAYMFLQLCKHQNLNPFLKEAYLIKYSQNDPATMVVGKDTFTKRADRLPQFDGFKAGVIVVADNNIIYREGSFILDNETLVGGWTEVYRKDRTHPFRVEVSLREYIKRRKDGTIMKNWQEMPGTMIRKVALVQALREAFPDAFAGMYTPEEMPIDTTTLPNYSMDNVENKPAHHQQPIAPPRPKVTMPTKGQQDIGLEIPQDIPHSEVQNHMQEDESAPVMPSTLQQQKAIRTLANKLGTSDKELYMIINTKFDLAIDSIKQLTMEQASNVINYFNSLLSNSDDVIQQPEKTHQPPTQKKKVTVSIDDKDLAFDLEDDV